MVKPIGIQRIEKRFEKFRNLIDMSDWDNRPRDQQQSAFLSRAVAAYCVKIIAGTDDATAGRSVTDSFHDRGIDAIFFDMRSSRLILVQSKWSDSVAWKEAGEFIDGVTRLLTLDWRSFSNNEKITKRQREIELALETSATRILLVTAHKGATRGDDQSLRRIDELVEKIDDGTGLGECQHWHRDHLLAAIQTESSPQKINADLYLSNWGEVKDPYHAVYGRVQAQAIAQLWKDHPELAHENIREYSVQRTDVNAAIAKTVVEGPQHFWYFNNGLTVICDSIKSGVFGRLDPQIGLFKLQGIRLVNGAQTTGVVSYNLSAVPEADQAKLWIQLRAIAVAHSPEGFAAQITKFTNLQNAVSQQDFVAMDPVQARLAVDFAIEGRRYAFKWGGDPDPSEERGCTLKEATVALACASSDNRLAVQAKREIGVLWNTESSDYKSLFHGELSSQRVWNAVKIMRAVHAKTDSLRRGSYYQADPIGIHLKLLILHLVFRSRQLAGWHERQDPGTLATIAGEVCERIFKNLCQYIASNHSTDSSIRKVTITRPRVRQPLPGMHSTSLAGTSGRSEP